MKKLPFQFRVEPSSGIFLVCWCVPWTIGLIYMLWFGEFNWGVNNDSELITRSDHPVFYWTVVSIVTAMIVVVLRLTFELRTEDESASNSTALKPKQKKEAADVRQKPPRRRKKKSSRRDQ